MAAHIRIHFLVL